MPVGNAIRVVVPLITIGVDAVVPVGFVALLIAFGLALGTKVTCQWQRAIVLRLGKFSGVRGPGLFFITPLESVAYLIDLRTMTTLLRAEETITADTVPVEVDAVLFWRVTDPQSAALEVENYSDAVSMAAQTALRDLIGRTTLTTILSERQSINHKLEMVVDARTQSWGIHVESVEVRDIRIPQKLDNTWLRLVDVHGEPKIAALAYSLWEARGCPEGSPEEDWFNAERTLAAQPILSPDYCRSATFDSVEKSKCGVPNLRGSWCDESTRSQPSQTSRERGARIVRVLQRCW